MRLTLNGELRETPELATVADLAEWLGLPAFGSAIERNGEVVPRASQARVPLREGDHLEIVRLVGGG